MIKLSNVVSAAGRGRRVARLIDGGTVIVGTARSIGDERGYFAARGDDIRDCYLRVTTDAGVEAFWKVSDLVEEMGRGEFSYDYDY